MHQETALEIHYNEEKLETARSQIGEASFGLAKFTIGEEKS